MWPRVQTAAGQGWEVTVERVVVVTGASRGLGLAFVRALLARGDRVVATARHPVESPELDSVAASADGDATVLPLDVTAPESAAAAAAVVADLHDRVDVVINNAGLWSAGRSMSPLADIDPGALLAVLRTNAVGPVVVTQAFQALLARAGGSCVANLSSGLGSLSRGVPKRNYGYAMSKAALNMATLQLADELSAQATQVVSLDPGWVKTDLGGPDARLAADEAATALLGVIDSLPPESTGAFLDRRGRPVDW